MNRRNFLRDTLLIMAASLLPKILQPSLPQVQEEEMVDIQVNYVTYMAGIDPYSFERVEGNKVTVFQVTKEQGELIAHYISRPNTNV